MENLHLESPTNEPFSAGEAHALERLGKTPLAAIFIALTVAATPAHAQTMKNSIGAQVWGDNSNVTVTIDGGQKKQSVTTSGKGNRVNTSQSSREDAPSTEPPDYCAEDPSIIVEGSNNVVRNTTRYGDGTEVTIIHSTDEDGEKTIAVVVKLRNGQKMQTTCP